MVLGQDLPPAEFAGWPSQAFAIVTAVFGLASFALVLALIEQARGLPHCGSCQLTRLAVHGAWPARAAVASSH